MPRRGGTVTVSRDCEQCLQSRARPRSATDAWALLRGVCFVLLSRRQRFHVRDEKSFAEIVSAMLPESGNLTLRDCLSSLPSWGFLYVLNCPTHRKQDQILLDSQLGQHDIERHLRSCAIMRVDSLQRVYVIRYGTNKTLPMTVRSMKIKSKRISTSVVPSVEKSRLERLAS